MVVLKKDGTKLYYDLHEEPVATFENGQLVLTASKASVYYDQSEVARYTFEGVYYDIGRAKPRFGETVNHQSRDAMSFEGLPKGTITMTITFHSTRKNNIWHTSPRWGDVLYHPNLSLE